MSRIILFLILLLSFAASVSAQHQPEKIINFDSSIIVHQDASIDVTEVITVFANDDRILHGIVRRLPMRYTDSYGIKHKTRYDLRQIFLNNSPSTYHTEYSNDQFAVYIGKLDVMLSPGTYIYTVQYHVKNAINFLQDADEFYWNVTGNEWDFPIQKARVNVNFPTGVSISNFAGYTGEMGAKGQDFSATLLTPNQITYVTTNPLKPGEGLTIAMSWPKGIIHKPTLLQEIKTQLQFDQSGWLLLIIAIFIFIYYLSVWYWYGKDPRKGTIIPRFEPPENLSPAALHFIHRMGADCKTFTATVVSLATKGFLTIENQSERYTLIQQKPDANNSQLPEEEKVVEAALFARTRLELTSENSATINRAKSALNRALKKLYENRYFVTNIFYLIPGVLLTLLAIVVSILSVHDISAAANAFAFLIVWTGICFYLIFGAWNHIKQSVAFASFGNVASAILSTLYVSAFLMAEVFAIYVFSETVPLFTVPLLFLMMVINIVFYQLMKRPTLAGRKLMDEIEGFKLFLSTTERFRLNQLNPPEATPALFEKYLPYAIALGVEFEWGNQFNEILQRAGMDAQTYHPVWYSGTAYNTANFAAFSTALNSQLNSAIRSSSSSSSSSSASSGGGSSGGGGGGGGGGGW